MKTTLQVKLLRLLSNTRPCWIRCTPLTRPVRGLPTHAYAQRCASKFQLQKQFYQEVRQRFGLSAQLAIRAIAKTVEAYKRDKSVQVAFRPEGAVVYDERIMTFHGLDAVCADDRWMDGQLSPCRWASISACSSLGRKGKRDLVLVRMARFFSAGDHRHP